MPMKGKEMLIEIYLIVEVGMNVRIINYLAL